MPTVVGWAPEASVPRRSPEPARVCRHLRFGLEAGTLGLDLVALGPQALHQIEQLWR